MKFPDTSDIRKFGQSTTGRLTATYLAIIMLMSVGFSIVFFHTTARQLDRQLPTRTFFGAMMDDESFRRPIEQFIQDRIGEGRHELIIRLIGLNVLVLCAGSMLSYALARKTLEPIEAAMDSQSQFVSDASHELRTPLTAIQTSNDVALRKPKLSLAEAKDIIRQNTAEVVKLRALSDALLKLATGERHRLILKPINIQEVISEALDHVVAIAQAKGLAVIDESPNLKVRAHRQSLEQVITILLDNAIKYSDSNTTIRITGKQQGKTFELHIIDQGVGIRASDLPHIFKRFYRVDRSRSKTTDGYGLGLAIAETLMREQHGSIQVKSHPNKGSTFTIKLASA